MKNTTFVSAGAGSGKTYRLTQDISQMIRTGKCRAEEIILTTYTEAAAKELREKVRSTLYADGLYDAAMNIDNAAIGTIHSIAYQLVSRYWYLLGISANVSIMPKEDSVFYISQSLSSLLTNADLWVFETICKSFNIIDTNTLKLNFDFWKQELNDIIGKTVSLCINEQQLAEAREQSKQLLNEVIQWNGYDITNEIVNDICVRLKPIFDAVANRAKKDKDATRKELYDSIADIEKYTGDIGTLPIRKLMSVLSKYSSQNTKLSKYVRNDFADDVAFFDALLSRIPASNQVKNLIESYIDTLFRLAADWKNKYEAFKQERCLLDFNDLLLKFDELLGNEEVVRDLRSRYKVAFVDEFQDCSPLQVRSFKRLSEIMEQSVWVGDIKQSIYGFNGTNIEQIKTIIDEVDKRNNGNCLAELKYCWRSNKTIIDLVNSIFCEKVFKGQIEDKYIRLDVPVRAMTDSHIPKERELRHMHFVSDKQDDLYGILAEQIKILIDKGTYKANEIAVLYYSNKEVLRCVAALKKLGIPHNAIVDGNDKGGISADSNITSFIDAVVSFAARSDNELSKAIIVHCIEEGYSTSKILSDKLRFVEQPNKTKEKWLAELDIFERFAQIRKTISNQGVSAAIETIIVELNLGDLLKRIEPTIPAYNYCSALQSKASVYEKMCSNLGLNCSLLGFVEYLSKHPIALPGDDNGVSVMTYHKSKGLEWPCVILCSLNKEPINPNLGFFGVVTLNTPDETKLRLVPSALQYILKGSIDNFEDNDFFKSIRRAAVNEAKRLMYVGMTRPKEQLIFATYGSKGGDQWLTAIGCDAINLQSEAEIINWGGSDWVHSKHYNTVLEPAEDTSDEVVEFDVLKQPKHRSTFDEKFISPSKMTANGDLYKAEQCAHFADRLGISSGDNNDATIGNFIHHAMCLWNGDKSVIAALASMYNVSVDVNSVVTSISNFWDWMEKSYGKPTSIEREVPFSFINENGQTVNGEIDLVYCTNDGDVLVDYKTYQGSVSHLLDEKNPLYVVKKYGGQIQLYEEAMTRDNRKIRERLICYMSLGVIIRLV